ncbi:choline/Carnitine o-acyltransferase domain-containing protein [Ditylenchus destructor]|uniref:Choline/Carnitine o-acyltransferase domain-containing protein n=1 Tax=Ditylenchus destructor TaxID=166010 RepID=A0AAD4R4J8_9BILA|nr:choline/Carnitine o-acyltransferase domain-containing protein [Ditylenchus destructor]
MQSKFLRVYSISRSSIQCKRYRSTKGINYDSDEYQYLHKSEIPTYHFQKSLRRLPIPKLEDSCRRYLDAVNAVVSESDYQEAEKIVKGFLEGKGPELQQELLDYDSRNKHTSYVSEPWFDLYLTSRVPCPVNYNPFMMFAPDPQSDYNNQLLRATNFAIAIGRFKRALDAECLGPEVFHLNPRKSNSAFFRRACRLAPSVLSWWVAVTFSAFPLDMSQYSSLFGGNRIPQKGKDRLHLNTKSRHFLVVRNGNFFSVELFDANGKLHRPEVIHRSLADVLQASERPVEPNEAVGSLTTLDRDTWAEIRSELIATGDINAISLRQIDDALFLLCLDDLKSTDPLRLVNSLLCGDDGSNRWFDKCFQLIVDGNGQATVNFEHSWGDGVAILRLMEETLKDTVTSRFVTPEDKPNENVNVENMVQKLEWQLNDALKSKIKDAQNDHVKRCANLQFGTVEDTQLTRSVIKNSGLSPDSVMQLAIQHAFYRMYKEFVPTYESCSTAAFLKGRTECVRSATKATRETVLALEGQNSSNKQLRELFNKCSKVHSELVKQGAMGQGFDRHLLGLKITAERLKQPIPEFFENEVYKRMGNFVLSTSTLSTETIIFGGFGPVVPDGFGIGYNVVDSKVGAVVSSYKDKRDAQKFCESLSGSLDTIRRVISEP